MRPTNNKHTALRFFITYCDYPENDPKRIIFETKTRPRFEEYCKIHDFKFIIISENVAKPYNLGFAKMFWIKQNLPVLSNGDVVTYMDIDCCIMNGMVPAVFEKDFAIVQESTGCLCMGGTWSVRISDWSRVFIEEMCSEKRQEENKDLGSWKVWHENDAIYHVIGLEWGAPINTIGTRNTTPFSKEELNEHIQILPPEWGTTFSPDDPAPSDGYYAIISCYYKKENYRSMGDIIVRHLSAGTMLETWADRYYNIKMKT
jgi:hypothetical protein